MHHLDGAVETGALIAVVGPNGAGKSTLFKGIVGVLKPFAGRIERGGLEPQDIAYLPQAAEIDRSFPINVYDMVAMGLWRRTGLFGGVGPQGARPIERGDRRRRSYRFRGSRHRDTLRRADAAHAVCAAAAAGCPRDRARRAVQRGRRQDLRRSVRLVQRWHGEQRTVLTALHDIDFVRAHFPETLLLAREPVAWGRTAAVLTPENLLTARRMCEAFDEHAAECWRRRLRHKVTAA